MEIGEAWDVLELFPVRKSRKQKDCFRSAITEFASRKGYVTAIEQGSLGAKNIVIGSPEQAKYLVTAHYDTCARMLVPNLITPKSLPLFLLYQLFVTVLMLAVSLAVGVCVGWFAGYFTGYMVFIIVLWALIILMMIGPANPSNANDNTSGVVTVLEILSSLPDNQRSKVCFVLFDLEELGLIGSSSYRRKHKKVSDSQIILNLDCVGEGDEMYFFPTRKMKKDTAKLSAMKRIEGHFGKKTIIIHKKGFSIYPSDQGHFPNGFGICALKKSRLGPYLSRIHTVKDTILDKTNVNILRAALITLISSNAVE